MLNKLNAQCRLIEEIESNLQDARANLVSVDFAGCIVCVSVAQYKLAELFKSVLANLQVEKGYNDGNR